MTDLENALRQSLGLAGGDPRARNRGVQNHLAPAVQNHLRPAVAVTAAGAAIPAAPLSVGEHLIYRDLSHAIIGAAIEVHRHLGPGQLESTYQRSLEYALADSALSFRAQVPVAARFKGRAVGEFFVDLIVEDKVLIELKAVSAIAAVHRAQVISYLHATRLRLGLLINFHEPVLYRGVTRLIV